MNSLAPSSEIVKAPASRLVVGFDGTLAVVDNGTHRRPSILDLLTLTRPGHRIAGFRDSEV